MANWHDARGPAEKLIAQRWRIGRSVGRTIYVCEGRNDPSDTLIGMVDSQELAEHIVAAHNALIDGHDSP